MTVIAPTLRKARAELLGYVLQGLGSSANDSLHRDLVSWLEKRGRFEVMLSANRDKVRKKLRSAAGDAALLDVRAELLVASLLSTDRRFELGFEAYGSGRRGPDFTVVFRDNQRFNVEVTRLRPRAAGEARDGARLAGVLLGKVRQLTVRVPNVIALVGETGSPAKDDVAAAVRLLKIHADRRDDVMFTRGGFEGAREFYAHYVRLSAVAVLGDAGGDLWINPEARHSLPREAAVALSRCLTAA